MQQFGASMFHMVVQWYKLGKVENDCTLHNFIILAINLSKIIKVSKNLTKLWLNNFDCFFLRHGVNTVFWRKEFSQYVYSIYYTYATSTYHSTVKELPLQWKTALLKLVQSTSISEYLQQNGTTRISTKASCKHWRSCLIFHMQCLHRWLDLCNV